MPELGNTPEFKRILAAAQFGSIVNFVLIHDDSLAFVIQHDLAQGGKDAHHVYGLPMGVPMPEIELVDANHVMVAKAGRAPADWMRMLRGMGEDYRSLSPVLSIFCTLTPFLGFKSSIIWPPEVRGHALYVIEPDLSTLWRRLLTRMHLGYVRSKLSPRALVVIESR